MWTSLSILSVIESCLIVSCEIIYTNQDSDLCENKMLLDGGRG